MAEAPTHPGVRLLRVPIRRLWRPAWQMAECELLPVEPLGDGAFSLLTAPFFAYRLSRGDVVEAAGEDEGDDRVDIVGQAVEWSGHSTLRLARERSRAPDGFHALARDLMALGCRFERSQDSYPDRLYALDIPDHADYREARALVRAAGRAGDIDFEVGKVGHG